MKDETQEDINRRFDLLRSDPAKYMEMMDDIVASDPADPFAYHARHYGWVKLGQLDRALADLNKSLELERNLIVYDSRGVFFMKLGLFRDALSDFASAEALNCEVWRWTWGPLFQAHCHCQLGDLDAALTACDHLSGDHWSPGLYGTPRGDKKTVIAEIRRRIGATRGDS